MVTYINLKPRMGQECTEHYVAYIARHKSRGSQGLKKYSG